MLYGDNDDRLDDDSDFESLLDTEASVVCPWCGENVSIALDPWGGSDQVYTEDCEVCCQPWRVHVTWDEDGGATVQVDVEE